MALAAIMATAVPAQAGTTSFAMSMQTYYARERLQPLARPNTNPDVEAGPAVWTTGDWSEWSSSCSDSATRTRTVTCLKGGTVVPDATCTGAAPSRSEVDSNHAACESTYEPRTQGVSGGSYACEAGGVKTVSVVYGCYRKDTGALVADSSCAGLTKPSWSGKVGCQANGTRHEEWNGNSWGPRFNPVIFDGLLTNAQVMEESIKYCNQLAEAGNSNDCYMTYWYHYGSVGKTGIDVGKTPNNGNTVHQWPVTKSGLNQKSSRGVPQYRYDMSGVPTPKSTAGQLCGRSSIGSPSYWIVC